MGTTASLLIFKLVVRVVSGAATLLSANPLQMSLQNTSMSGLLIVMKDLCTTILINIHSETSIKTDLTTEKPIWDLSIYGPAKEEPNMIVGTDLSPEEDRVKYYQSRLQTGNETQYVSPT